jgi:DNA helicase-2/ATP-dependent DNA helicase PcrA
MTAHPAAGACTAPPASPRIAALLEGLTPSQQEVVLHNRGPLLVYAGPGAGKTMAIVHRVARLVADGLASPSQILAMTFTVRAAEEMRGRLADPRMLGSTDARGLTVGTFHSMCAQVLRNHATTFGRTDAFTIYDTDDTARIVEQLLGDRAHAETRAELEAYGERSPHRAVATEISLAKNRLLTPEMYAATSDHPVRQGIVALWTATAQELAASNAFDFDDLLTHTYSLFAASPAVLRQYQRRWPWILVDEYQDNNAAQIWIVALLAGETGNITAVADPDQAIYRFRGSEVEGTLEFGDYFPGFSQVTLRENFRSRSEILAVATACIAHNASHVPKDLVPTRGPGGSVDTPVFPNEHAEAEWLVREIREAIADGVPPREIHVIARNGGMMQSLQRALAGASIPYRVLGDLGFFERKEVRDALAYLELLVNPRDARALRRALRNPRRGIGEESVAAIIEFARARGLDLIQGAREAATAGVLRRHTAREALQRFADAMLRVRFDFEAGVTTLAQAVQAALMIPDGLVPFFKNEAVSAPSAAKREDAQRVLEDLRSLCRAAGSYAEQAGASATIAGFVESTALLDATELEDGEDRRLTLCTGHRSKGLGSRMVVALGCEERILPSWRAIESPDARELEEERRLFYVIVTRACDRLVLSRALTRRGNEYKPSRFLAEGGLNPGR